MSARLKTKLITLTGTAQSLSTLFGFTDETFFSSISLRSAPSNLYNITWSDENNDPGGVLEPGDAATIDVSGKFVKTTAFKLLGTAGEKVYVTLVE
jgi:hypothetical protein